VTGAVEALRAPRRATARRRTLRRPDAAKRGAQMLSPKEEAVLGFLAAEPALLQKELAARLGKSRRTLEAQVAAARLKLGAETTEEAIALWRRSKRRGLLFSESGAPIGRAERAIADILAQLQEETGLRVESIALDGAAGALSPLVFVEEP
jgi:DNA-binding CsgD family transcriptional regulator